MGLRFFAVLAVSLLVRSACAAAMEQRPPLKGVSAMRVANYGAPSVLLKTREQVDSIVDELNGLRNGSWRRGDTKLSCYSTLILLSGERTVGYFRVRPEYVVERPLEKGQPSYSLAIGQADLPALSKLLTEIPSSPRCK